MPNRMLGRLPHDPERPVLKLSTYLASGVPSHPQFAEYLSLVHDWDAYGNLQYGTCGPAAVGNQRKQVSLYLPGDEVSPTLDQVLDLYRASGNPNFDPTTDVDDNGVVMADMLSALLTTGLGGVKPLAYAAVDVDNPDEVRAAIGLFGSVLLGVDLDEAQDEQTENGQPWDYVRRSKEWGGHCVLAGAYTSATGKGQVDLSVVTWGQVQGVTDEFCARQLQEAYVVLWPEVLGTREFENGVDLSHLAADYEQLTGRPFPSLPSDPPAPEPTPAPEPEPAPEPSPEPVDPDAAFKAQLSAFMTEAQAWLGGSQ